MDDDFRNIVAKISIRGRLAMALGCFESACCRKGLINHPEIQRFLDHMWRCVGQDPDRRPTKWEAMHPELVHVARFDQEFSNDFLAFLKSRGIPALEFNQLLDCITEIIFVNAYGAANNTVTLDCLTMAIELACKLGGICPNPDLFAFTRWEDDFGWGMAVAHDQIAKWRTLESVRPMDR